MALTERYETDLGNERDYRKDLEKRMNEVSELRNSLINESMRFQVATTCLNKVNEAAKINAKSEQRMNEITAKVCFSSLVIQKKT